MSRPPSPRSRLVGPPRRNEADEEELPRRAVRTPRRAQPEVREEIVLNRESDRIIKDAHTEKIRRNRVMGRRNRWVIQLHYAQNNKQKQTSSHFASTDQPRGR